MPESALAKMIRGMTTRDYEGVVDTAREGFGIRRSSASRQRHFVRDSAKQVEELAARRFDEAPFVAIFIDGLVFAGEAMVCMLGLADEGRKRIVGLRQRATENRDVVTSLLADLVERGLSSDVVTLFVLDGAKALHAAVNAIWGRRAVIQRARFT